MVRLPAAPVAVDPAPSSAGAQTKDAVDLAHAVCWAFEEMDEVAHDAGHDLRRGQQRKRPSTLLVSGESVIGVLQTTIGGADFGPLARLLQLDESSRVGADAPSAQPCPARSAQRCLVSTPIDFLGDA